MVGNDITDKLKYIFVPRTYDWKVVQEGIKEIKSLREEVEKLTPKWIKVEDGLPEEDACIYFVDKDKVVHNGSYSVTTDFSKPDVENDTSYSSVLTFAGFNYGYDGDSGPVYNVTHWMYENVPEPPKDEL